MFDPHEARRILRESFDGLSRTELEERLALSRELAAWAAERKTLFRAAIAASEAER